MKKSHVTFRDVVKDVLDDEEEVYVAIRSGQLPLASEDDGVTSPPNSSILAALGAGFSNTTTSGTLAVAHQRYVHHSHVMDDISSINDVAPHPPPSSSHFSSALIRVPAMNAKARKWALILLMLLTSLMVGARSVDFVLYTRIAGQMNNYVFYLGGLLLSLMFNAVAWPIAFLQIYRGKVTKEQRAFPKKFFLLMALCDFSNVVLGTYPAPFLPGSIQVAVSQSVIPFNLIVSFIFLKTRYLYNHYIGILVLFGGLALEIYAQTQHSAPESGSLILHGGWEYAIWLSVLIISNIPAAFSNVVKEYYLKDCDLDVWYLNAWVSLFQFLLGLITLPLVLIKIPGQDHIAFSELGRYLLDSLRCTVGENSKEGDICTSIPLLLFIFITFNMTYNITILAVFKRGSSTLAVIASAVRLALSGALFLWPFLAGVAYQQIFGWKDIVALSMLILAIVIYQWRPEQTKELREEQARLALTGDNEKQPLLS